MILLNDVEVYIGENLLFPTTYTVAKSVKKSLEQNEEEMLSVDKSIGIYAPDGEMESIFFCNHELENTNNGYFLMSKVADSFDEFIKKLYIIE